jgi:hypothetical protein
VARKVQESASITNQSSSKGSSRVGKSVDVVVESVYSAGEVSNVNQDGWDIALEDETESRCGDGQSDERVGEELHGSSWE